jgi:hypothetical protein
VQVRHILLLDKVFEVVTVLVRAVKVTVCAWFESAMSDGVISEQRMGDSEEAVEAWKEGS